MGRERQRAILEIISGSRMASQQQLVEALKQHGITATQSSVSRDIARLGLIKLNGYYAVPGPEVLSAGPIVSIDTAGECLIVIKTEIGQASPTALKIDRAGLSEIVGTVAGDDTMLIAVKNVASQRMAIKKIVELFNKPESVARAVRAAPATIDTGSGAQMEGISNNA